MAKSSKPTTTRKSTTRKAPASRASAAATADGIMGLSPRSWISGGRSAKGNEARSGSRAFILALDSRDPKPTRALVSAHLNKWQMELLLKSESEVSFFHGSQGAVVVLRFVTPDRDVDDAADSSLAKSPYARGRDVAASVFGHLFPMKADKWILEIDGIDHEQRRGLCVGLELASYTYAENRANPRRTRKKLPTLLLRSSSADISSLDFKSCGQIALCTNIARHLVNLPAADLNPRTYAELVESMFSESSSVKVETWSGDRLRTERMDLLRAVGDAAEDGPRFVHIRYRPKNARAGQQPIAFVGKGITFDTGGLDIKPSSAMRLMKKDMGGSAACVGIAKWAELSQLDLPLDIYLSLAENAIGGSAFRPGDIITARNGLTVEIHNTDAEGRLVLADALDVAVNQTGADQPACVIDLATLTGAIKVGLGADIAGLFSNHDRLADALLDAGAYKGDLAWRMPLYQPYKSMLRSNFADFANATDGFAGAITAALFLQLFTGKIAWAHLDIYSWKDSSGGAYSECGGNGQPVQMLAEFLTRISESADGLALKARP